MQYTLLFFIPSYRYDYPLNTSHSTNVPVRKPYREGGLFLPYPDILTRMVRGNLHSSQNFPLEYWQENGSVTSFPQ
jgi:hypothetical protein